MLLSVFSEANAIKRIKHTKMTSKYFVLQHTNSENFSVARVRASISISRYQHVATLPENGLPHAARVWNKRHASHAHILPRLLSPCCRCGTAAVLLLADCFASAAMLYQIHFYWHQQFFIFYSVGYFEVRELSLYEVCVRPRALAYKRRTACIVWYTLSAAAARSLLLTAVVVAGKLQNRPQRP